MMPRHFFKERRQCYLIIFITVLIVNGLILSAGNFDLVKKAQAAGETLPMIYGVHPSNMTFTFDRTPSITAFFAKGGADINLPSLTIILDGKNVTKSAEVNFVSATQKGTVSLILDSDLSYGEHDVKISISDNKGQDQQ